MAEATATATLDPTTPRQARDIRRMALDLRGLVDHLPSLDLKIPKLIEKIGNAAQQSLTEVDILKARVKELEQALESKKRAQGTGRQRCLTKEVAMTGAQLLNIISELPSTPAAHRTPETRKRRVTFTKRQQRGRTNDSTTSEDEWSSNSSVSTLEDTIILATAEQRRIMDLRTPPPRRSPTPPTPSTPSPSPQTRPGTAIAPIVLSPFVPVTRSLRSRKK